MANIQPKQNDPRHIKTALVVFVVAIVVRFAFHFLIYEPLAEQFNWAHVPDQFNWYADDLYDEMAHSLIAGNGFSVDGHLNIRRTFYPLILAIQFTLLGDGYYANLFINILYQSAVCILLYYLSIAICGQRNVAIISSVIWAIYPLPMLQAMGPFNEPVYTLILVAFVFSLHRYTQSLNLYALLLGAFFLLILTLIRPISILYPAYFVIVAIIASKGQVAKTAVPTIIVTLVMLAGVTPWMQRGYEMTGEIPLINYGYISPAAKSDAALRSQQKAKQHPGFAVTFSEELREPSKFLHNSAGRLVQFWYFGHSATVRIVNGCLQFPLLVVALFGICIARKRGLPLLAILSTVIYFWLAYAATHAISRYSFPFVALLCPYVALALSELWVRLKASNESHSKTTS